jgi:muconate cycloisomerase
MSEPEDRFQFTLSGLMGGIALAAAYFWLIRNREIGAPLVCVGFPMLLAAFLLFVTIPREISGLGWSPGARVRGWWRQAVRRRQPSPVPVPAEPFERFDTRAASERAPAYDLAGARRPSAMSAIEAAGPGARSPSTRPLSALTIDAIEVTVVNLPCRATFHLAGGDFSERGAPTPRALVKVVGSNGVTGWGEVTPCPTWCYETSESITSTIRNYLAPALIGLPAWNLDAVHARMERVINPGATTGQPLAKSGIDVAIHDMLARSLGVPLYVLLGGKRLDSLWLSYIVSAKSADEAAAQARQGLDLGYTAFKIKVGLGTDDEDFAQVAAVHDTVPKGTPLWVDANQGYGLDNAIRQARRLGQLGVIAFEQPLKGSRPSEFRRLVELGAVPIAIDESLCSPTDLIEYIKAGAVDLPVAKVQRTAGLWPSRWFCAIAEAAGLRLMGSGLCETDLGLATGVHLFSAFGIDLPCDLNGRQFVDSAYLAETVTIEKGRVRVPEGPGIGVEVDEALVRKFDAGM